MPNHSCRVCYDCDSQFTVFNRRHHCRLCGRVFCGGCTSNCVPAQSSEPRTTCEDWDKIRVCNYCFKQWEQGLASTVNNGIQVSSLDLSSSPTATSFTSTKSSDSADSSTSIHETLRQWRSHIDFVGSIDGNFDKPLGRFLRDNLFDQMPSEAHVHCYTHRQGTLTISVKKLPEFLLPGEKEGRIWMWHRCLRCPRTNGFPPATRRIVMSDAAWGLSFGKFLELSFSNHAAASRVASCGHSLHRDCLRFYWFGKMVACFRYALIDVHSVYLPPSKLDFNYENQGWINRELDEVVGRAELLFSEVLNAIRQVAEKRSGTGSVNSSMKTLIPKHRLVDLEGMLHKETSEFESFRCACSIFLVQSVYT